MCTIDGSVTLREATEKHRHLDSVEALLDANGLPCRNVRANPECFFAAVVEDALVGAGGLETFGPDGLLRSVVVRDSCRGRGYGTSPCDGLESHARETGIETLYLLTTTASAFFRGRGYDRLDRAEAPASIRQTTRFTDLCPASGGCLGTQL